MPSFPDYYSILFVSKTASADEIRQAYRKESLRTHPDRLANATDAERKVATGEIPVADAYYVLSDPVRRREYDTLYSSKSYSDKSSDPKASSTFFDQFTGMFGGTGAAPKNNGQRPDAENVFADVFDELLRPEVERHAHWWSYLGAACGGGIGLIVANIPGLMLGAFAGNRLGAVRDAKGKSIAAVFSELGATQKAEILRALAFKFVVYDRLLLYTVMYTFGL
ncbi:DnaJ-domain-containing protein [Melanogaster broomeanus]|nr:DnaJ-domain-containing protein [Melanogaster broomeanus]